MRGPRRPQARDELQRLHGRAGTPKLPTGARAPRRPRRRTSAASRGARQRPTPGSPPPSPHRPSPALGCRREPDPRSGSRSVTCCPSPRSVSRRESRVSRTTVRYGPWRAQSARYVSSASPCSAICTVPSSPIECARRFPAGPVHQRADGRTTGSSSMLPLLATGDAVFVTGSDVVEGVDGGPLPGTTARCRMGFCGRMCYRAWYRARARCPPPSGCPRRIASRNRVNACVG